MLIPKIVKYLYNRVKKEDVANRFYPLLPTCQIPQLDKIYEQYFGRITNGTFIDVGAYDGDYASNSSGLADTGWFGYNIEPVTEYYEKCKKRHEKNKNVIVSNYAIGKEAKMVEILIGGPLSTINLKVKRNFESLKWAKSNFKGRKIKCKQITLDQYLNENKVMPEFELLSIDVEGYEWDVLQGFNIKKWLPKMVIIELHDQNDDYKIIREECNNIVNYFDKNEYKVIFKDFTNTIYVPRNSFPR